MIYGDGSDSSINQSGTPQFNQEKYNRKAVIDLKDEMYLSQMSNVETMPKHYGKTMKKYHYIPLLEDENVNSQGLDVDGLAVADEVTITIVSAEGNKYFAVGSGADAAGALTAAQADAFATFEDLGVDDTDYATTKTSLEGAGWTVSEGAAVPQSGNLYGSSRDIGAINSKLPTLTEVGGRVNRVGFTRKEVVASLTNYGFFHEWTKDSMNFDTDPELKMHLTREAVRGATQINEDILSLALVNGSGVNYFGGSANSVGSVGADAIPTYNDLINLDIELDNNRCPRDTKVITGSKMIDTKTIKAARYMFISADVKGSFMAMKDYNGDPAFIDVKHYAGQIDKSGKYMNAIHGEIGSVGPFRIVVHPKMVVRESAGSATGLTANFRSGNNTNFDVYPCLVVGSDSFSHIGFEYGAGAKSKFKIRTNMPGQNLTKADPYGKTGFTSIEFWNATLVERPEWIAVYNINGKYNYGA